VSEGYHAKIGDFGLSTVVSTTIGFVPHSQVLGMTLLYSPPELLTQRGDGAGKPADVYAFAISMNHVFARQVPYSNLPAARNHMLLRDLITTGTRPTLAAPIAGNAILRGIVEKGWHDTPAQRPSFQTIRDQLASVRL
jgi:serine/threonine protein kinase